MPRTIPSVRIFDSAVLERFSHVHPATPALLWTPVIAWLLWRTFAVHRLDGGTAIALGTAGVLVWTFTEYVVHRFAFHLAPSSAWRRRVQFIIHGVHHEDPHDRTRLLMPPAPAIATSAMLYCFFRAVLGPAWVEPFFACFILGYLAYDYTHFAIHARKPRTRLGRYLRRQHMLHHFVTPNTHWGVSSPLWDWIFRSTGRASRRERQAAAIRVTRRPRWWRALASVAGPVAATLLLAAGTIAAGNDWEKVSEQEGLLIERRAIAGSSLAEIRATVLTSLSPILVAETLWNHRDYTHFVPYLKRLDILFDGGDERLTYEQVSMPLVSDRDYTVRVRRRANPAAHGYEISFESDNAAGPSPDPQYVRVGRIRGKWTVGPAPGGLGALVRYQVQAEAGGNIPDWLANLAQRTAAADLVRAMLRHALERARAK